MAYALQFLLAVALSGILLVEGKAHYYDFVLEDKNFTRLCSTKSALVVNGTIPGPAVYVNKNDTMFVNVHNNGSYKVTIHWHGVRNPRNPWSDGPEYITQCGIQPGTNFTYEVIFSDEEGTLWWHAHSEWTRNTVHGAIVIYPQQGHSYPFPKPDAEEILVLGSWYTYDPNLVVEVAVTTGGLLPESDSYTINGQPGDFCACSSESTYRWVVDYGKTYLLRIINAAMNAEMFFAIAQHNLTIVGVDGAYVKPFVASYIMIVPGQSMDVLVTTNKSGGQYYMAGRKYTLQSFNTSYDRTTVSSILEYRGNYRNPGDSSPVFPSDTLPEQEDLDAAVTFRNKFRSLYDQNVPINITTRMYVTAEVNEVTMDDNGTMALSSSLNNVSWVNPRMDVLRAYYYNMSGFYTEDFPDIPPEFYDFVGEDLPDNTIQPTLGTKVKVLEYGEEVEMVFQSSNVLGAAQDHPMHLHGHSFYVVGAGDGNFDFDEDPKTFNLVDPPSVNTATVPENGWLAIRFKALNPGVWLWHCHFDHHLSLGMVTVMIVKNGGTSETSIRKPPANLPPCSDAPLIQLWKSEL